MEKLYIVIPAYNEEMNITSVAREWHTVVETISEDSKLVIIFFCFMMMEAKILPIRCLLNLARSCSA